MARLFILRIRSRLILGTLRAESVECCIKILEQDERLTPK